MILKRIAQYIKDNGITSYEYHTWREVEDKKGKVSGEIRVLVLKDKVARVEYKCPECGHEAFEEKPWKRPFNVNCSKCSCLIRVPKLRDQIKKKE